MLAFFWDSDILFFVMRDMFDNMYEVRIANSGDVAGFPRSHDGLEKAIILASSEGTEVTFDGEVVWSSKDWFFLLTLKSDCFILFFVMGMIKSLFTELSCEEEFELNAWCDERREADIATQNADMVAEELARQSDAQLAEGAALDLLVAAG